MKLIFKTLIFSLAILAIGCKSEKSGASENSGKQEASRAGVKTIKEVFNDRIVLADGSSVPLPADKSVIFMVRHAETNPIAPGQNGNSRTLKEEGIERAEKLKNLFANVDLEGVLSTSYVRAAQTAKPLAESKGKGIFSYNHLGTGKVYDFAFSYGVGKRLFLVGHSDTVPAMIRELTLDENAYKGNISEDIYDSMFIVAGTKKGDCTATEYRF